MGSPSNTEDALLTDCLARAQAIINMATGRPDGFEAGANTTRYFNAQTDVDWDKTRRLLHLGYNDLAQIATVTNGDGTVISSSNYITHPVNYGPYFAIQLKLTSSNVWTYQDDPESAISISGRWAYSVTAPPDITHACIRVASWIYRQKDSPSNSDVMAVASAGVVISPAALPADVRAMLQPYARYT
jgi:hypothetical protein